MDHFCALCNVTAVHSEMAVCRSCWERENPDTLRLCGWHLDEEGDGPKEQGSEPVHAFNGGDSDKTGQVRNQPKVDLSKFKAPEIDTEKVKQGFQQASTAVEGFADSFSRYMDNLKRNPEALKTTMIVAAYLIWLLMWGFCYYINDDLLYVFGTICPIVGWWALTSKDIVFLAALVAFISGTEFIIYLVLKLILSFVVGILFTPYVIAVLITKRILSE